jgi:hypothetical protein
MNIHKLSPAERRRDNTTYVRDLKTGDVICVFDGWFHAFDTLRFEQYVRGTIARTSIDTGPCEGVEYITADDVPVAWIDEGPGERFLTDEIHDALFPMRQAAE